ncbi:MAG: hypothetical protein QM739_06340 [Propionivibrio sp.]
MRNASIEAAEENRANAGGGIYEAPPPDPIDVVLPGPGELPDPPSDPPPFDPDSPILPEPEIRPPAPDVLPGKPTPPPDVDVPLPPAPEIVPVPDTPSAMRIDGGRVEVRG